MKVKDPSHSGVRLVSKLSWSSCLAHDTEHRISKQATCDSTYKANDKVRNPVLYSRLPGYAKSVHDLWRSRWRSENRDNELITHHPAHSGDDRSQHSYYPRLPEFCNSCRWVHARRQFQTWLNQATIPQPKNVPTPPCAAASCRRRNAPVIIGATKQIVLSTSGGRVERGRGMRIACMSFSPLTEGLLIHVRIMHDSLWGYLSELAAPQKPRQRLVLSIRENRLPAPENSHSEPLPYCTLGMPCSLCMSSVNLLGSCPYSRGCNVFDVYYVTRSSTSYDMIDLRTYRACFLCNPRSILLQ